MLYSDGATEASGRQRNSGRNRRRWMENLLLSSAVWRLTGSCPALPVSRNSKVRLHLCSISEYIFLVVQINVDVTSVGGVGISEELPPSI